MNRKQHTLTWFGFLLTIGLVFLSARSLSATARTLELGNNWQIQPAAQLKADGSLISRPDFGLRGWYKASVPGTVLANLIRQGLYKDLYFGRNLEKVSSEPFKGPWWYRTEFVVAQGQPCQAARLILEGLNYKAEVWLNGQLIKSGLEGAFTIHELDISSAVRQGNNALAVKVFPPQKGDLTIGFVDWSPGAPDGNMGLWRGVKVRLLESVSLENLAVQSKVKLDTLDQAELLIDFDLVNHSQTAQQGELRAEIDKIRVSLPYELKAGEQRHVTLSPQSHSLLRLEKPRLWWPTHLGEPNLYTCTAELYDGLKILDQTRLRFGIRDVRDYINDQGHRGYMVNGKKVLIRGAAWVDDMLLADSDQRVEAQMRYFKHMNLNTVRLEGFWGNSQKLYDMADELGLLLMVGLSCQWEWEGYCGRPEDEFMSVRGEADIALHAREYADQVRWLRHHPSILVWVFGSDKLPSPAFETELRRLIVPLDQSRPILGSCKYKVFGDQSPALELADFAYQTSQISGPTRVKMMGPYQWEPPIYWYIDRDFGGAFGFNTETGPGPQVPPIESIKRMIPADKIWPINEEWEFHGARGVFSKFTVYAQALEKRYGSVDSAEAFTVQAQMLNYESIRPMFEAFATNRPTATGVIQWMGNSAWPKMVWQLFDYYLMPTGAFYGTRKACQPLNLVYHYGERNVWLVNETLRDRPDLLAEIRVLAIDGTELLRQKLAAPIPANSTRHLLDIPSLPGAMHFLSVALYDGEGRRQGDNFYWISAKRDVLDKTKTAWYWTPTQEHADYTDLKSLPQVTVRVKQRLEPSIKGRQRLLVSLENTGTAVAFFMEMGIKKKKSRMSVLPVFWSDNYVSLLPGEKREYSAEFALADLNGELPVFTCQGQNIRLQE